MPAPLVVESVARRFGEMVALYSASLELRSGELLALLGPNGAGKTTLIRSIAGRLKTDSGTIDVQGIPQVAGGSAKVAVHLGVIPQEIALYDTLTAVENLQLFGSIFAMYLPLPGCVALPQIGLQKHGTGGAAADRSQGSHSAPHWSSSSSCGRPRPF